MAKFYSLALVSLLLLALGSCQSLEQISIDYMQPGDMTFPSQLRKVAIVNNTSTEPDNKLITQTEKPKENVPEISHATAYANGNVKIAAESLAEEIAHQNYFDVVVICDSALRANDKFPRESTLSQEEVQQLASDLGVDCIIAMENLQFKATKTVRYIRDFNCYLGTVDVKAYPTVKVYLPSRSKPMTTLHPTDSIFWEEYGETVTETFAHMIPDAQLFDGNSSCKFRSFPQHLRVRNHVCKCFCTRAVRYRCVTQPSLYAKTHGTEPTSSGNRCTTEPRRTKKR